MQYDKSSLQRVESIWHRECMMLAGSMWDYRRQSFLFAESYPWRLQKQKIVFYKGNFVEITTAKKLSDYTAYPLHGSIVEYKEVDPTQINNKFVITKRRKNGKRATSPVMNAVEVIAWIAKQKKSTKYTVYTIK